MIKRMTMNRLNMTKWICLGLCALLCTALMGVPLREARAAGTATVAVVGPTAYGNAGEAPGLYTATVSDLDTTESVVKYVWAVDGTVLTNGSTHTSNATNDTFTPGKGSGWANGATTGSVSCTVTITDTDVSTTDYTPDDAITGITVGKTRTLTLTPDSSSISPNDATDITVGTSDTDEYDATTLTASVTPTGQGVTVSNTSGTITVVSSGATEGNYTVTVTHPATGSFPAATQTTPIKVAKIARTLSLTDLPSGNILYASATDLQIGTSLSPDMGTGAITWDISLVPAGVTVTNGLIHVEPSFTEGSITGLKASIAADDDYTGDETDEATIQVKRAKPTVTMPANFSVGVGATGASIGATSTSSGAKTFTSSAPAVIRIDDAATGKYTALATGTATITFTQAQDGYNAAVEAADAKTVTITVSNPTLAFSTSPVTITADKGTASVTAAVSNAGSATLTPVDLSGYDKNIILVKSTSSSNGSNTFTIIALSQGATEITATTKIGGTTVTTKLPVTVDYAEKSYFTIDGWYHYLKYDQRYSEITATLHNPGNGVDPDARTYWSLSNNVSKEEWSHQYLKYDESSHTYYTRLRVIAMRNGTTTAYLSTDSKIGASYEFHVTEMSYIPQAGQDSTAIYVAGALLLISAVATVTVFAYRRKRSRS